MSNIIKRLQNYFHVHSYPKYYYNYMIIEGGVLDGIGRHHCTLKAKCEECGEWVSIGMIHMKADYVAPKYNLRK